MRRDFGAAAIPIVLGVATLVVGCISWGIFLADETNISTSAKHSDLKGVFHRVVYGALRTVSDFAPSVWNVNEGNYGTDVAALLGAAAFYASVFLIAANVMSETVRRFAARYWYKNHVVIIGETPLASRLTGVWRRRVPQMLQVITRRGARPPRGSAQVRSAMDGRIFARFGLGRAASVFVDLGDDMVTLSLAFDLLGEFAKSGPKPAPKSGPGSLSESRAPVDAGRSQEAAWIADWILVVRDRTLADHFAESVSTLAATIDAKLPTIRYFSPERAVVRHFLAGRPLFLEDGCRQGIHALVIGSGAAVDELIQAIFLTGLVAGRAAPRVTVLSLDPARDRSAFFSRRPGLIDEADIAFLPSRALDDLEPVARLPAAGTSGARWDRSLYDRDVATPVNVIFLMDATPGANSRLAIKLKSVQKTTGRLWGTLFGSSASFADEADQPGPQGFGRTIDGYETFGLDDSFLDDELCTTTRRRTLAYALHENYRKASVEQDVAPWDKLPESLRRANGNAADHCLAKLHMLGFDVARIPSGQIPRLRQEDHLALRAALRAEPLSGTIRDVVFLEHDRWALERRFDGWIYGTPRDNAKLIHPLLVAWDRLSKADQDKDRDQVEALLECLQEKGDRSFELRRRPAPATALAS